jgi:hypothetical protein
MKKMMTLLALTISVGAFAQERVVLNSSEVDVRSATAILVRTAQTPDKVEIRFNNIPLETRVCVERVTVPRTCFRQTDVYQTRTVCRNVVTTPTSTSTGHTGPNYNPTPTTRRVCTNERYYVGTRQVPYDCSYTECRREVIQPAGFANDKVKIKFKGLPNLGGTEEETFQVNASQNGADNSNIVYSIMALTTVNEGVYVVNKKGIFGYDSYVIERK